MYKIKNAGGKGNKYTKRINFMFDKYVMLLVLLLALLFVINVIIALPL
jgi:hypothetical protein